MAFLEPDEIARIQTFLRSQAGAQMPSAKGAALASKQSSTTSGKCSFIVDHFLIHLLKRHFNSNRIIRV